MITWKDAYKIGVEHIDEQHQELFRIAGKIYELLRDDLSIDKYDRILALIQELKDYTVFHFNSEEKYMQQAGYKKFLSHKVEHDDFIAKINDLDLEKIDFQQEQYIIDILDFVVKWIEHHILHRDKLIIDSKNIVE
ncbi:MAG: bacteriohemerythrin [Peptococcaceae bacterium]